MWELESPIPSILSGGSLLLSDPGNPRLVVLGGRRVTPQEIDAGSLRLGDQVGLDTPPALDGKGLPLAYPDDVNKDGIVDLVVEFPIPALVENGDATRETTELLLTGTLAQGPSVVGAMTVTVAP